MIETRISNRHKIESERPYSFIPCFGLQGRLIMGNGALRQSQQVELKIDDANTLPSTIAIITKASINERREATQNTPLGTWKQDVVNKFSAVSSSVSGTQFVEFFSKLGINCATFNEHDAQNLYEKYFSQERVKHGVTIFLKSVIDAFTINERVDVASLKSSYSSIKMMAGMFGENSSEIIIQLLDAEIDRQTNPEAFILSRKDKVNRLSVHEKYLLSFLTKEEVISEKKPAVKNGVLPQLEIEMPPETHEKAPFITPKPKQPLPQTMATQDAPVYSTVFTKQTAESLARCGIDTKYINPTPLGQGANHVVYMIDTPGIEKKVLKISKPSTIVTMTDGHEGEKESFAHAITYFTHKYIPMTDVYKDPNSNFYCIIQDAVKGKEITNLSIRNKPEVLAQLAEIVKMNNALYKNKRLTLDFVGMNGFMGWLRMQTRPLLLRKSEFSVSNILIDDNDHLKIIDFEFFDLGHKVSIFKRFLNWIGTTTNRVLMKHYFGLDILK